MPKQFTRKSIHPPIHSLHAVLAAFMLCSAAAVPAKTAKPKPTPVAEAAPTPAPQPAPKGDKVSFTSEDGIALSGVLYGKGSSVVVLSHQYNHDQDSWQPLVSRLLAKGYAVLTYNFRGYPPSAGKLEIGLIGRDLDAAAAYARSHGATHLALVGASMGGIATVPAALAAKPDAYVVISSPREFGSLTAPDEALKASKAAKLFINSKYDKYVADTQHMQDVAAEPKAINVYSTGLHGVDLFDGPEGDAVQTRIVDFIAANLPG
ncbi:alpha/beta hydrolase family protein [Andreprevotia chitinilytica]|uniref:alpha/beta hydrolase family protein n=1 Tax=Andreprevotia chitinilytica TaxID=396808 RepID=UPI00055307B6|nr:alpha/beta fold hydrolase [Andreprevotia chitinilytica]